MLHHKYVFAALCCLCCATADDAVVPASDVIDLTDASFAKALLNTGPHLVKFYSPNCGHCKAMAPVYEELATQVNADPASFGGNRVARMDCTKNQETCKGFRVTGFPRLMLIALAKDEHGRPTASHVTFKGARELPALRAFVKDTPDVKAAQEALAARQKLELEERGKRAKAAAERLEAMALKQEVAIAAGAAAPERRIVTAGNFDALFGRANATAGNALLLRCFVPGALQNAFSSRTVSGARSPSARSLRGAPRACWWATSTVRRSRRCATPTRASRCRGRGCSGRRSSASTWATWRRATSSPASSTRGSRTTAPTSWTGR